MILGRDILSEINVDLCISGNIIRRNGCAYEGYTTPMKNVSKINFNASFDVLNDKIFWRK